MFSEPSASNSFDFSAKKFSENDHSNILFSYLQSEES